MEISVDQLPAHPQDPATSAPRPQWLHRGLEQLLTAHRYARQLDRDPWDFALEAASLRAAGLTNSDLRYLICLGYVEHAREITRLGESRREFRGPAGLSLFKRSCFLLTKHGLEAAEDLFDHSQPPLPFTESLTRLDAPRVAEAPRNLQVASPVLEWDGARHQFRVNGQIVKEFKVNSPNQETILATFQEEGWPPRIDDPLPRHTEIDPKRRLHDTIKSLNRNQKLRLVRFMGDGSGEAVRWEPYTPAAPPQRAK